MNTYHFIYSTSGVITADDYEHVETCSGDTFADALWNWCADNNVQLITGSVERIDS